MTTGSNTSTRLRSVAAAEATTAVHFHKVRWGLAYKFALPVAIVQALVLATWGWVVLRQVRSNQLNETLKSGVTAAKLLHARGAVLLRARADFRAKYPDFDRAPPDATIPFAAHWLVAGGEVTPERWSQLTNTPVGEPVRRGRAMEAERNAAVLEFLVRLNRRESEVLSAYICTVGEDVRQPGMRAYIAATEQVSERSRFDPVDWMRLPRGSAVLEQVRIGRALEPIAPIQVAQGAVSWPDNPERAAVNVLQFTYPIRPEGTARAIGEAVVALRADVISQMRGATSNMMLLAGSLAVALATGVCFLVANLVTRPIRRLLADMEVFAAGEMEHRTSAHSEDEIGLVAAEFNQMAARLEIALGREKEAARLETELTTARDIQTSLLPPRVPFVRGFDLAVCYRPAREVGGDYYDFLPIDGSHLGIIVADVSGKSIPGALVMSLMRATLRFFVPGNLSAADTLRRTNAFIAQDIKRGMFVSAFYLILDVSHRRALCASAGHNPLVVCRADGTVQTVSPGGIALGFDKGPVFDRTIKEAPLLLSSGDRVVIYTDGVVEAMNQKNEEYGEERFHAFVRDARALPSRDFIGALLADLDAHQGAAEQHDDITLVTFRVE